MDTKRIRLLQTVEDSHKSIVPVGEPGRRTLKEVYDVRKFRAGDVVEVPGDRADNLIALGYAENA